MIVRSLSRRAINIAADLPIVHHWRLRRYEKYFASHVGHNVYRGVFNSFDAAAASAPRIKPVGYDNEKSAQLYLDRRQRILLSDYPAIFWLGKFFSSGCRSVFDLGGNIGISYYAYQRLADYPAGLRWIVYDVPTIVELGRSIAAEHDTYGQLLFADNFNAASDSDLLLANGVLQFLADEFEDLVSALPRRPHYLIINRLPLHPNRTFFTLQSIGTAFCPYRVRAEHGFLAALQQLGYEIVDHWLIADLKCEIPFYTEHYVKSYQGFACISRM